MDNKLVVKETTLLVKKKPLILALLCLDSVSLQARIKLKNSFKNS